MQPMNQQVREKKFFYPFARRRKNLFGFGKNKSSIMNRREALTLTTMLAGSTIIGSQMWLSRCSPSKKKNGLLSDDDVHFLDEVGETILPKTAKSPGAKEAHIGEFMKTIVTDFYDEAEQKTFLDGIEK